ncbi:GNAT family N-acetyltransferase [Hazenella sp. IB182357]|uniref:GNAT family N-acetyltransferase n=1 Tax=Polycladospora coralii TaxID=2771432 RepID=A0A926N7T8_9BACL|nr:GNAT family N-acetyltransferase [Polycladospora coralii]MBD1373571.1 GNAT family N-acetyltransferase [Polycladospora coralii]MBS7531944.1 GNAT family N-acetyltransferase [Polycladospora coralii]
MILRRAYTDEAVLLSDLALESKAYWNYDENFIEACKESLTITSSYIKKYQVYVCLVDEEIIGFFAFIHEEENRLDFLYIRPNDIGKGYGKRIWKAIVQTAKTLHMESFTIPSDPNAQGYYEKMGATQIGTIPSEVFEKRSLPLLKFEVTSGKD